MANLPTQQNSNGKTPYEYNKEEFSKITQNLQTSNRDYVDSKSCQREERYNMSNAELIALLNSQDRNCEGGLGWNNPFFYLIFIWLFASFGNGGFGGFGGGEGYAAQQLSNEFLFSNLNQGQDSIRAGINSIGDGLCTSTYELSSKIDRNRYDNAVETQRVSAQLAECCCATNRNIDALANQLTMSECSIRDAIFRDGEMTRALINANTVQALRDELQTAQIAMSNAAQTVAIGNSIDSKLADILGYPCRPSIFHHAYCPTTTTQG